MSREFVKDLPPHLRAVYDKTPEPDPMKTHFQTLRLQEEMKDKARKTSVVYKLLGERLFGDLTIHGWLNLNIPMVNIRELNKTLIDEMAILSCMSDVLTAAGDDRKELMLPPVEGDDVPRKAYLYFSALTCVDAIDRTYKDLKEAHDDLIKLFHKPNDLNAYPQCDSVFVNKDEYEAISGMRRMLNSLSHPGNPANHSSNQGHIMYFRNTVKLLPLCRSMRDIRW